MLIINKNKIELIGKITSLSYEKLDSNGKKYMFFDIVQNSRLEDNSYSSSFYKVKLNEDLLNKYQDIIKVSKNIYINGYLNTYLKDKQNVYYIFPKEIKLLDKNYNLEYQEMSVIDYDKNGNMLWNGKSCESIPLSEEEQKEMEDLLSEFQ